jgi:hypothetical protein
MIYTSATFYAFRVSISTPTRQAWPVDVKVHALSLLIIASSISCMTQVVQGMVVISYFSVQATDHGLVMIAASRCSKVS